MADIVFVHVLEPDHPGGGADVRARALAREVGRQLSTELLVVGPDSSMCPQPNVAHRLAAAARGIPPRFSQRYDPSLREQIRDRVSDAKVVVAETLFVVPYLMGSSAKIVLDAHNVESEVVGRLARRHPSAARRFAYAASLPWSRHWEASIAGQVAQVWAVSDQEAEWFGRHARDVIVVPNGVTAPSAPTPPVSNPSLIFVGALNAQFNRDGLRWFLSKCWPSVRTRVPGAILNVVGQGSQAFNADGVVTHGFVPDLGEVYGASRVAIVPLLDGAGTRLKALEALAYGRPVVSTTIGTAGINLVPNRDALIVDDADGFANACVTLLQHDSEAARFAANGRQLIAKGYDWGVIGRKASAALRRLM
jgi:glycosyltransferase involved in cell wall biosynthesis